MESNRFHPTQTFLLFLLEPTLLFFSNFIYRKCSLDCYYLLKGSQWMIFYLRKFKAPNNQLIINTNLVASVFPLALCCLLRMLFMQQECFEIKISLSPRKREKKKEIEHKIIRNLFGWPIDINCCKCKRQSWLYIYKLESKLILDTKISRAIGKYGKVDKHWQTE